MEKKNQKKVTRIIILIILGVVILLFALNVNDILSGFRDGFNAR
jgi:hypothetical protein